VSLTEKVSKENRIKWKANRIKEIEFDDIFTSFNPSAVLELGFCIGFKSS
jgi:hypothetical protein